VKNVAKKKTGSNARAIRDLLKQGRMREAMQALDRLDNPSDPKPSLKALRARALIGVGDLAAADTLTSELGTDEESVSAMAALARAWLKEGNAVRARVWLQTLKTHRPQQPDINCALAIAAAGCGDVAGAEQAWEVIAGTADASTEAARQVARGFWLCGLADETGRWLEKAGELAGHNLMELARAGVEARQMGCLDVAVTLLRHAHSAAPEEPLLAIEYALAMVRNGDISTGRELMERAVPACANVAEAHFHLAEARRAQNDLAGAHNALEAALSLDPGLGDAQGNLAVAKLELEQYETALSLFDERLMLDRVPARSLAFKSITLEAMGRPDEADDIAEIQRRLQTREMGDRTGHDVGAFNEALARHLVGLKSLRDSPPQHATRGGLHSGELFEDPNRELQQLKQWFTDEAAAYMDSLVTADDDPFAEAMPEEWDLTAWCVLLDGGGYQQPHIHTSAWLSGVYYVQLPDEIGATDETQAGWLQFGIPDRFRDFTDATRTFAVTPAVGKLLLFPAHCYHRTIPVANPSRTRISIAFDLVPGFF
jgi:uncharacterized protein (TIGR02466 family)